MSASRVDGLSVVGLVGETTGLVDPEFELLPMVVLALDGVVWLFGGAWVVALFGLVQTKKKKEVSAGYISWVHHIIIQVNVWPL